MVELWFAILCLMLVMFTVLGGWDFGAGALSFVAARNQEERRMLMSVDSARKFLKVPAPED